MLPAAFYGGVERGKSALGLIKRQRHKPRTAPPADSVKY